MAAKGTDRLRIAFAQMNQRVGDLEGNARAMLEMRRRAEGADLLLCPELQVTGYPPEDFTEGRVQLNPDGSVACLGTDLSEYDAVDAGLSVVEVQDVLAVSYRARKSWLEVRQQMLAHGYSMQSEEVNGLWADVDTPEEVRKLERSLWRRLGRKPTDGVIARVLNRHISGPLTRLSGPACPRT